MSGPIADPPADPGAPVTDPPKPTPPTPLADPAPKPDEIDWKAEARKHEARAKANAKAAEELEKLKASQMSEQEKAVAEAKKAGRDEVSTELRSSKVELAVYRLAGKHQGDADALLDSRSFQAAVAELDPTASDFASKVEAAIKAAVKDNPKLKAEVPAGRSGGDSPPGGGGDPNTRPANLREAFARQNR